MPRKRRSPKTTPEVNLSQFMLAVVGIAVMAVFGAALVLYSPLRAQNNPVLLIGVTLIVTVLITEGFVLWIDWVGRQQFRVIELQVSLAQKDRCKQLLGRVDELERSATEAGDTEEVEEAASLRKRLRELKIEISSIEVAHKALGASAAAASGSDQRLSGKGRGSQARSHGGDS